MENYEIIENKTNSSEKDNEEESEDCFNNLVIDKISSCDVDDLNEISVHQYYIQESVCDLDILTKINLSSVYKLFTHKYNTGENFEIIPNKMKTVNNLFFFTFCQISKKNKKTEIIDFNFLIKDDIFSTTTSCDGIGIKSHQSGILLNSTHLGVKFEQINNFDKVAGFKFFSNFFLIPLENSYIIFLIVYKYIYIIKIRLNKPQSQVDTKDSPTHVLNYEILFKKEFNDCNLLLYVGSENLSKRFKFYVLYKPGNKLLTFTYLVKKENCPQSNNIHIEENNLDSHLEQFSKNKLTPLKSSIPVIISRVTVTNSSELLCYDRNSNNFYLLNKFNFNKIRVINDSTSREIRNHKNFFTLPNKKDDKSQRIYLITDEIIDEESLKISLWKIDTNKLNDFGEVVCDKLQCVIIKTRSKESELGDYNFSLIDDCHFALYFQDYDVIFIFNLTTNSNTNDPTAYIERIYEFEFEELFAYMFDYQINQDGVMIFTMYQDEEFLRYKIDLNNYSNKKDFKIQVGELQLLRDINKEKSVSSNQSGQKKSIESNEVSMENLEKSEKNHNDDEEDENNIDNFNSQSPRDNLSSLKYRTKSNPAKSKKEKSKTPSNKSEKNKSKSIESIKITVTDKKRNNLIKESKEIDNAKQEINVQNFSECTAGNLVSTFEDRIDKILNSKINTFSDKINNQLQNVFSLMKTQTEELTQIRKKNEEAMNKLIDLVSRCGIKNQVVSATSNNNNNSILATATNTSGINKQNDANEINQGKHKQNTSPNTLPINSMINSQKASANVNNSNITNTVIPKGKINMNFNNNNVMPHNNQTVSTHNVTKLNNHATKSNLQQSMHLNPMLAIQQRLCSYNIYPNTNVNQNITANNMNTLSNTIANSTYPSKDFQQSQQSSISTIADANPCRNLPIKKNHSNSIHHANQPHIVNNKSLTLNSQNHSSHSHSHQSGQAPLQNLNPNLSNYYNHIYTKELLQNQLNLNQTQNTNYPYTYNQGYGYIHPYYLANLNYMYNKTNEITTDGNKFKEDDIALENFEKNLSEIKRDEMDYKMQMELINDNNKNINYSSDIREKENLEVNKKEVNVENSMEELDRNSVSDQNFNNKNELNVLNSFFSNMNGEEILENVRVNKKKPSSTRTPKGQKLTLNKVTTEKKICNSNKKKKNKKKKNK